MLRERALQIISELVIRGEKNRIKIGLLDYCEQGVDFVGSCYPTGLWHTEELVEELLPLNNITVKFHSHAQGYYFEVREISEDELSFIKESDMYDLYLSHLDDIALEANNSEYYFKDCDGILRPEGFFSNDFTGGNC